MGIEKKKEEKKKEEVFEEEEELCEDCGEALNSEGFCEWCNWEEEDNYYGGTQEWGNDE